MEVCPDVLGRPLPEALEILRAKGWAVVTRETTAPGSTGGEREGRVARGRVLSPGRVEITVTWALKEAAR